MSRYDKVPIKGHEHLGVQDCLGRSIWTKVRLLHAPWQQEATAQPKIHGIRIKRIIVRRWRDDQTLALTKVQDQTTADLFPRQNGHLYTTQKLKVLNRLNRPHLKSFRPVTPLFDIVSILSVKSVD